MAVTVEQPTQEEIRQAPRAFALLKLIAPDSLSVDQKALEEASKTYGSGKTLSTTGGKVPYAEVAALLSKPGTELEGHNTLGWAARDKSGHLSPFKFDRRPVGEHDVRIQILACGICHSDLHQIKDEWTGSAYPEAYKTYVTQRHEVAGVITEVGSAVKGFKVGEHAGIGCYVRACEDCEDCTADSSQYCPKMVVTYNGKDWGEEGHATQGGYSTNVVVAERYVLHLPNSLPMLATAPLLCAGITVWSPMQYYGLNKKGMKVGVMGLGGLGHMAVKFGKALGLEVTVISTSPKKEEEARKLGAHHFIVSKNDKDVQAHAKSLDGIIDTVSAPHELSISMGLLRTNGKLVLLGVPPEAYQVSAGQVVFGRKMIGGSMIGSIKETQEMLDFCGQHGITCEIEKIPIDYVNTAMERLVKNDVHFRFSIDVAGTLY